MENENEYALYDYATGEEKARLAGTDHSGNSVTLFRDRRSRTVSVLIDNQRLIYIGDGFEPATPNAVPNSTWLFLSNERNEFLSVGRNEAGLFSGSTYAAKAAYARIDEENFSPELAAAVSQKDQSFWMAVTDSIYNITTTSVTEYKLKEDLQISTGAMLVDEGGNIWIGTAESGLLCLKPRRIEVHNPNNAAGLSVIQAADGAMWLGTSDGVIRKGQNGERIYTTKDGMRGDITRALAFDKDGYLWIGTDWLTKLEGGRFSQPLAGQFDKTVDQAVNALYFDRNDTLWIGFRGLGLMRLENGNFKRFTVEDGLPSNSIHKIFQDSKGTMWIGTREGLSRLDNGKFSNYSTENGLSNNYVREILEDPEGRIWIGTYGGGDYSLS